MQNPAGVPTDTDRWFVQIKEQVIGPLPGAKVLERLLKDELDVTHRVSRDRKSWAAICNTPFFEELVLYSIRIYSGESVNVGQMHPGGDDSQFEISQVFGLHGATDGISEQLDHARQLEELTANIQKLNYLRKEIQLKKKTVIFEKEDETPSVHPEDQNVFVPVAKKKSSFRFADLFKSNGVLQRRLAVILTVIIVASVAFEGYERYSNYKRDIDDRNNMRLALEAEASGNHAKAIQDFKNVKGVTAPNQNLATTRDLVKLATAHTKGNQPVIAQQLLSQAITMNPEEFVALHNLGVLNLKNHETAAAEKLLLHAYEIGEKTKDRDNVVTLLALFETAVILDKKVKSEAKDPGAAQLTRLETVEKQLQAALTNAKTLKTELRFALAVTQFYLGKSDAFRSSAYELIENVDEKKETQMFADLDDELTNWTHLQKICTDVYNQPGSTDFIAALYASCLNRSQGAQVALPFARYALAVHPTDPLYMGLLGHLLVELKQPEEASKILLANGQPTVSSGLALRTAKLLAPSESSTPAPAATTTATPTAVGQPTPASRIPASPAHR